jgi:predicted NBD/HSP70 family sugar kinase
MAHYLGRGAAMLVSGLSPELIVFVGDVARAWDRVGPIITRVVNENASTHPTIRIVPCDSATQPRVRGIIALVLQKHFGAPTVA